VRAVPKTLGPIIEKVVDETSGRGGTRGRSTIDANPQIAQAFNVQSIPAVFAIHEGKIVDSFVGAFPESAVREFVEKLAPGASKVDKLVDAGDEAVGFALPSSSTRRISTPRSRSAISCVVPIASTKPTRSSSRSRTPSPPKTVLGSNPPAAKWRLTRW